MSVHIGRTAISAVRGSTKSSSSRATVTSFSALPIRISNNKTHQRRPSSSKASCPPDGNSNGTRPAATAQAEPQPTRNPTTRSNGGRQSRSKKSRDSDQAVTSAKEKAQDVNESFSHLPSVPNTQHMHPSDITLSSFFSLHRPLNLGRPIIPPTAEKETFDRIFESSDNSQSKSPLDVIDTLSNTIEALEGKQGQGDLRWEVIRESSSNTDQGHQVRHLDGPPNPKSVEEMVGRLRPFHAPPAPKALGEMQKQNKRNSRKTSPAIDQQETSPDRSFSTTIIVHEMTGADGNKFYSAQQTPVVQITTTVEEMGEGENASIQDPLSRQNLQDVREPRQPFLERMRRRHWRYVEYREDRTQKGQDKRWAISVKRQRKLKMKKHKYKKLMKRTRTLRRRLDRA